VSEGDPAEPEMLSSIEGLDEDDMRVDPLEEGVDPPEHWSAADRFGTTRAELREGESLDQKLSEEQPDIEPDQVPDRPVAVTAADQLNDSIDDSIDDSAVDPAGLVADIPDQPPRWHGDMDPGEHADEAGGSVAEAIRADDGD
jgi:hypothetical protein